MMTPRTRRVFLRGLALGAGAFLGPLVGRARAAQSGTGGLDWLEAGRAVLEEHLDPGLLDSLRRGDPDSLETVLSGLSEALQGDEVADLADWGGLAEGAIPWLERVPRLRGYVPWLRSRLDYFRVAERLAPKSGGQSTAPNPTPARGRQAWQEQVSKAPAPKGAAGWVPRLKPVFTGAGAPAELVWLAELESSFDPSARSPAGAVGMYQLMPGTAEGLGLKLKPQDERLVPERSARAAAGYLRTLRSRFGDWRLALAAYNAGPGRVSDLLKRRRAITFDAIAPSLPAETQMYVPKFEAILKRRESKTLAGLSVPAPARR